jgi:hypothetical protein
MHSAFTGRRIVAAIFAMFLTLFTVMALTSGPSKAATTSGRPWVTFSQAWHNEFLANPGLAQWAAGNPVSLSTCNGTASPCTPDNLPALSADRFTSEATAAQALSAGQVNTKYVVYDIEDGNGTPANESASPDAFMKLFNQAVVAAGKIPVITPGLDLGNVAQDCKKTSGQTNEQWSIGPCNLWGHSVAGSKGLGYSILQTQTETTNLPVFDQLFNTGAQEIHSWFSTAKAGDEISTNYGTAAQEEAAVKSEPSTAITYYSFSSTTTGTVSAVWSNLQSSGW